MVWNLSASVFDPLHGTRLAASKTNIDTATATSAAKDLKIAQQAGRPHFSGCASTPIVTNGRFKESKRKQTSDERAGAAEWL